jgi:hypothetical protein
MKVGRPVTPLFGARVLKGVLLVGDVDVVAVVVGGDDVDAGV